MDSERLRDLRRAATMELVLVAPFVVLGAVLTLSLFGAIFGLPLLAVTVPIALASARVRATPGDPARLTRFRWGALVLAALLTTAIVVGAVVGAADLDQAVEFALLAVALAWIAGAWWVVVASRRRGPSARPADGASRPTDA